MNSIKVEEKRNKINLEEKITLTVEENEKEKEKRLNYQNRLEDYKKIGNKRKLNRLENLEVFGIKSLLENGILSKKEFLWEVYLTQKDETELDVTDAVWEAIKQVGRNYGSYRRRPR